MMVMENFLKKLTTFLFLSSNKMLSGLELTKCSSEGANREDPYLGLPCLSRPFCQAIGFRNYRTFYYTHKCCHEELKNLLNNQSTESTDGKGEF